MIITPGKFAFTMTMISMFHENTLCTRPKLSVWNSGIMEIIVIITIVSTETNISPFPRKYI